MIEKDNQLVLGGNAHVGLFGPEKIFEKLKAMLVESLQF